MTKAQPPASPTLRTARARHAVLTRHRAAGDPVLVEASRALAAERIAAHIKRVVDAAPPLTSEQRDRLAELLRGGQ